MFVCVCCECAGLSGLLAQEMQLQCVEPSLVTEAELLLCVCVSECWCKGAAHCVLHVAFVSCLQETCSSPP
jgi:hypothetical protein